MQTLDKSRRTSVALWLATALLFLGATIPTLLQHCPVGHDVIYHCMRILNIAEEMKLGNLFPKVYTFALDGLGYGAPLFYSDLFLYPFAALNALGLSIQTTFKLLQIALLIMNFASIYTCAQAIFRNRVQAHAAALAYTFSFYSMMDIYFRAAIGECFAFVWLPAAYLGYYFITHGHEKRWPLLALGMVAILLSHTLSLILAAVLMAVLMLFDARFWIKNASKLRYIAYAALLCIGLTCYFWLPMLEQLTKLSFRLNLDVGGTQSFIDNAYNPLRLLASPLVTYLFKPGSFLQLPRLTGLFDYAMIGLCAVAAWKVKEKRALIPMAVSLVFVWLSGRYSPSTWLVKYFAVLQFPWRFLLPATLMLALFVGAGCGAFKSAKWQRIMLASTVACAITAIYFAYPAVLYDSMDRRAAKYGYTSDDFIDFHLNFDEISDGQYLPDDLEYIYENGFYAYLPIEFTPFASDESVTFELSRDESNVLHVSFAGNEKNSSLTLPLILYAGYEAKTDDGETLPISRGESGMAEVSLGSRASGTFTVRYVGTPIQRAAASISLIVLVGSAVGCIAAKRRWHI